MSAPANAVGQSTFDLPKLPRTCKSSFIGNLTTEGYRNQWTSALEAAKATFASLESDTSVPTRDTLLRPWDILSTVNFLFPFPFQQCHPDKAMREEADESEKAVKSFVQKVQRSEVIFERLGRVDEGSLDDVGKRFLERSLRTMRRAGAGLDKEDQAEVQRIQDRLTVLEQDFARNIDEGRLTKGFTIAELAGVPPDFFKSHPVGVDGLVMVSTDAPDARAITEFCDIRETRKEVYTMWCSVADPVNGPPLVEMIELQGKAARLQGYPSTATFSLETQMLQTSGAVTALLARFKEQFQAIALEERDTLRAELISLGQINATEPIQQYDAAYASTKVLSKLGGCDLKAMKVYFPADRTIQGVLQLAQDLFGISLLCVDVPTWHNSVTVHDVYEKESVIGRLYLDLHPRLGKYNHACAAGLVQGQKGVTLPEVVMVANIAGGDGALSSLEEATTLFHELGHCLHFIFGGQSADWLEFSGYETETDFVECISIAQEEWLKDPAVLKKFARHESTGEVIPDDVCEAIKLNSTFGNALSWYRQAFLASAAFALFVEPLPEGRLARSVKEIWASEEAKWSCFPPGPGSFPLSFGHLAGSMYGPRYYAYLYSTIISRDLLSAFEAGEGLMDLAVADRLKKTILGKGGQKAGGDLIKDFLGRPLSYDAFGKWLRSSARIGPQLGNT